MSENQDFAVLSVFSKIYRNIRATIEAGAVTNHSLFLFFHRGTIISVVYIVLPFIFLFPLWAE